MLWKKKRVSVGGEETYSTSCIRLQQLRSTDDDSECMDDQITTFSVEAVAVSVVTDIDSTLFYSVLSSFMWLEVRQVMNEHPYSSAVYIETTDAIPLLLFSA